MWQFGKIVKEKDGKKHFALKYIHIITEYISQRLKIEYFQGKAKKCIHL